MLIKQNARILKGRSLSGYYVCLGNALVSPPHVRLFGSGNDHVFCLLYREMWFQHLYARLSPTLKQRIDSWDNYCSLFPVVLHSVVNMQLPNQWLWDMVDEFVYKFQNFCQYRAKMKNKSEQEIVLLFFFCI